MESAIQLSEIERLAAAEAPDLAEAIISLLDAGDPSPDNVPEGALQFWQVLNTVRQARQQYRDEAERKKADQEAQAKGEKAAQPEGISLRQRAVPFVDMLRRAEKEGQDIVWGV
jgi:cyclopropane-fatty-acyl-phospholipid synthase